MELVNRAPYLAWKRMRESGLTFTPSKTSAIIISGRRRCRPIKFDLMRQEIQLKREVNYLGVILDRILSFGLHVLEATTKAKQNDRSHLSSDAEHWGSETK